MTEKSSVEIFKDNYPIVSEKIKNAAISVGKSEDDVILLAATKTQDIDTINFAIKSGIEYIGENRVQEFTAKEQLYLPVHKHFIGHLQTNKVKYVVGKCELIHSVDSFHLASALNSEAQKQGIVQDVLLEVNIGKEQTKSGFLPEALNEGISEISSLGALRVVGLMAIPPIEKEEGQNRKYFEAMYKLFIDNSAKKTDNISMKILSMGMSDDYESAVKCGANLVRIGTALFGKRIYK